MINIRRKDFEVCMTDSDGEKIRGTESMVSMLYNKNNISEEELDGLIKNGMYQYNSRVIVTTPDRADNMKDPEPSGRKED